MPSSTRANGAACSSPSPGQSRLHFTKERDDRRRQILTAILDLGVVIDRYDATGIRDQQQARAACLRAIVQDLAAADGQRLVLDQDDSLLRSDQAVLYVAVRDAGASDRLTHEHVPARTEPLLWVADAAAWCWSRGTPWPNRLQPITRHTLWSPRPTGPRRREPGSPTVRKAAGLTSRRYCPVQSQPYDSRPTPARASACW